MKYHMLKNHLLYSCLVALPLLCPAGAFAENGVLWATQTGGPSPNYIDNATQLAVDGDGNVYTLGAFSGEVDFDPGEDVFLLSAEKFNPYILKQDADGNLVWAWNLGVGARPAAIAADAQSNLFITGSYLGTVDFDPGAGVFALTSYDSGNSPNMFVAKLDSDGNLAWVRGNSVVLRGGASPSDIAIDAKTGAAHVVGSFSGQVDFDPSVGESFMAAFSNDATSMFVLSINDAGLFEGAWQSKKRSALGYAIVASPDGGAYIVGSFRVPGISSQSTRGYVARLNPGGDFGWSRIFKADAAELGLYDVAVNYLGKVFVSGFYRGNLLASADIPGLDFQSLPNFETVLESKTGNNGFILCLDEKSTPLEGYDSLQWARTLELAYASPHRTHPLDVDRQGNVYVAGEFFEQTDIDPGLGLRLLSPIGNKDLFLSKLNSNGDLVWVRQFAGDYGASCNDVSVGNLGSVHVAGTFSNQLDLDIDGGLPALTAQGYGDGFVAKLRVPITATSISRMAPQVTNNDKVSFFVVFGDAVTGVSAEDFLAVTGGTASASGVTVSGGPNAYVVEVAVESGEGTVGLSLVDDDSIFDSSLIPLGGLGEGNGDFTSTEFYQVDLMAPEFENLAVTPNEARQDELVTITFTPSEALDGEPGVTVNGNAATRISDETFTYTYLVQPTDGITTATITITGTDLVGNVGSLTDTGSLTIVDMPVEGEGVAEGTTEGEGSIEGSVDGEGGIEGAAEGEGTAEGEGAEEGEPAATHTADLNGDLNINLSELLRVFQLHTAGRLHCANAPTETEDGFVPGFGTNLSCAPHDSDYAPQDWAISLSEVLRTIQIHNQGAYAPCDSAEDGFCL